MNILLQVLLILLLAKAFGEFFERIGFPSVLGEISAGLLLASVSLVSPESETLKFLARLGAIFFLFTAGYKETNLSKLRATFRQSLLPTTFEVAAPFIFGFLLGFMFNFSLLESLFIGVALAPTSIGMTVRTLIDLDYLSTKIGSIRLNTSVLDDIMALFLLAVVTQIALYHGLLVGQLLIVGGKLVAFILIMVIFGLHILPKLFEYIHKMHVEEAILTGVIMVALFSAFLADELGLSDVVGAFVGGALLSTIPTAKIQGVQEKVNGLSYGLFVPIFFAFIGLSVELNAISTVGLFAALLIILALAGKVIGGFIGCKLIGLDSYDSLIYGVGGMPRVGVELVVISIAQSMGIIGPEVFSAIVLMVVVSVLITPLALKYTVGLKKNLT